MASAKKAELRLRVGSRIERTTSGDGVRAWQRTSRLGGLLALVLLPAALGALALPRHASADAADRSATHTYVLALAKWAGTTEASLPAALAEVKRIAGRLGSECPGVLQGVPGQASGPPRRAPSSERERGELERQQRQLGALQLELSDVVLAPTIRLGAEATAGFTAQVRPLHWDDPKVSGQIARFLALLTPEAPPPGFDFCADVGTWAQSSYMRLAAETRALRLPSGSIELFEYIALPFLTPFSPLLRRYESPSDRALAKRVQTADRMLARRTASSITPVVQHLNTTLGEKPTPIAKPPTPHGKLIERGRTADGRTFTVRVEKRSQSSCRYSLSIRSEGSVSEGCGSRLGLEPLHVECSGGELVVEGFTGAKARRARLLLSNGRSIESRVAFVPRRLGGPTGVYYQAIKGPAPIPVSLVELDGHGAALRAVRLNRVSGCTSHPFKLLPPGRITLAHGNVPDGGPSFTIVGERDRLFDHTRVAFHVTLSSLDPELNALSASSSLFEFSQPRTSLFDRQSSSECEPQPYEIVYGLLGDPRDTVLERTPEGLVPLSSVPLANTLHTGSALAYGAFSPPPTELIVEAPSGRIVKRESFAESAHRQIEYCEGYAEPRGLLAIRW